MGYKSIEKHFQFVIFDAPSQIAITSKKSSYEKLVGKARFPHYSVCRSPIFDSWTLWGGRAVSSLATSMLKLDSVPNRDEFCEH